MRNKAVTTKLSAMTNMVKAFRQPSNTPICAHTARRRTSAFPRLPGHDGILTSKGLEREGPEELARQLRLGAARRLTQSTPTDIFVVGNTLHQSAKGGNGVQGGGTEISGEMKMRKPPRKSAEGYTSSCIFQGTCTGTGRISSTCSSTHAWRNEALQPNILFETAEF